MHAVQKACPRTLLADKLYRLTEEQAQAILEIRLHARLRWSRIS